MSLPYPLDYQNLLQVGEATYSDNGRVAMRGDNFGGTVVNQLFGHYTELTLRKHVFCAKTAAAIAMCSISTATNTPTLWNKTSSGRILIPLTLNMTIQAAATNTSWISQGLCASFVQSAGDSAATGMTFATFTNVTPVPMAIGKSSCQAYFAGAVMTMTSPTLTSHYDLPFSQYLIGSTLTAEAPMTFSTISHDFQGQIVMPPGTAIVFGSTSTTLSTVTYNFSLTFAELPIPVGF